MVGEVDRALRHVGELAELRGLGPGSHVCCLLESGVQFDSWTADCLAEGVVAGQKLFRFSPAPAHPQDDVTVVEPFHALLESGPLVASSVYAMVRRETEMARREGFRGLRLVADMDWLLAQPPSPRELVAFELMLDELVAELEATVGLRLPSGTLRAREHRRARRRSPVERGESPGRPQLPHVEHRSRYVGAQRRDRHPQQRAVPAGTRDRLAHGPLRRLRLGQLSFISADGIAALAEAAAAQPLQPISVQGATKLFHECWTYLGLAETLPHVTFEQAQDGRT
jgi:hypothetical protein